VVVIVWYLDLQLLMQFIPIITNAVSSNPAQAIQHYVIKFVSDFHVTIVGSLQKMTKNNKTRKLHSSYLKTIMSFG
jgi:hypothetical protein